MTDSKKTVDDAELLQNELHELRMTNQQLIGEIDALKYRLDKLAYETEEIRREARDINRTVDKLRYDLLDAIHNKKTSEIREIISGLFPIFAITLPALFVVFMIFLYKMMTR